MFRPPRPPTPPNGSPSTAPSRPSPPPPLTLRTPDGRIVFTNDVPASQSGDGGAASSTSFPTPQQVLSLVAQEEDEIFYAVLRDCAREGW